MLIQFNVITFVSMVGVTLTFVFTVLFFRKIKNDFDKKCLHDSYIIDADALTTQQTEFRRLANVLKFWSATILICCTIITLRFVHILPYIESLKTGNQKYGRLTERIDPETRVYVFAYNALSEMTQLNVSLEYLFHTFALHAWQIPYIIIMWPKLHMLRKFK